MQIFAGLVVLVIALLGMLAVIGLGCYMGTLLLRDMWQTYAAFFRRARRSPRFGIGALFTLTTVFAAASALFRSLVVVDTFWFEALVVGVIVLVWATGIVLAARFLLTDVHDSFTRRRWHSLHDLPFIAPEPPVTTPESHAPSPQPRISSP